MNYFGECRDIATITPGEADEWRLWLTRSKPSKAGEPKPPDLAQNTARRHSGRAKQFFKAAVRKNQIAANPFADLVCRVKGSDDGRLYFVTRAEADKVLAACPSAQWRLVFALSRFGGMRCPSEHSELRVKEIDFSAKKMKIRSPKTEHLEGRDYRIVPIFDELLPYLKAAIAELPKGAEYVVTLPGVVRCRDCDKSSNLGTEMARIIKRAGLTPWPKLFQNLRATREIELAAKHPLHVVCEWIGNSVKVAQEHYLWAVENDFVKANGGLIETDGIEGEPKSEPLRNPNRHLQEAASSGTLGQVIKQVLEAKGVGEIYPEIRSILERTIVPRVGLEPTTY